MYESFFGLEEAPFTLNPDPRFLWLSETHEEGLAALSYGIATQMGFVLMTGGVGTGKTTLLRAALARVPEHIDAGLVATTVGLDDLDLLKLIVAEFEPHERPQSRADCLIVLKSFLLEQANAGRTVILIVDEAQSLDPACLEQVRVLSNLETESQKLIQIVVAGQPELRRILKRPELRSLSQRIVIAHHLEPLRPYEVRPYLEHRIQVAGGRYENVFEPDVEPMFFAYSAGAPRLVSALADSVMLSAFSQGLRRVPRVLVEAKAKELETRRSEDLWEADLWG